MDRGDGKPGAVIVGGSFHSLAAARNLAKHGVPVCVLDSGVCVARFSRYVRHFLRCPSADDEARLIEFLLQIGQDIDMNNWVVFPSTDDSVRILAQHWDRLSERCILTTQPWSVIKFVYDKRLTHQLAVKLGVPVPETHNPSSSDELLSLSLDFPVVLKPAISKRFMAATKKKAYRADDRQQLIDFYETMAAVIDPSEILIQEFIPGGAESLFSFVGFFKDGAPVAGFSARRPRQHPMEFGRASTYVEVVNVAELETLATRLLKGIAYSGLAEVEFMYDSKHARFELLEVNPRIWGWHSIAVRAGLDLPYLAYADAIGQKVSAGRLRDNVKWIRLVTDVPTAVMEILGGRLTVRKYLASMSGDTEFAVLSLDDPLPFIADLLLAPYNYVKGRGF
jgi:predicted ATP-grasp superfamily ATP-dependent carboligase